MSRAKHTHRAIVRYSFSDGTQSIYVKFASSSEEAWAKMPSMIAHIRKCGHTVVLTKVEQMQGVRS